MKIGFIGLGNMGGPMALNMIKAGHNLTVYDVRREAAEPHLAAGARWADSPEAIAAENELVVTSLPGPKEIDEVALGDGGIMRGIRSGAVYVDLSTNSPAAIRRLHTIFKEKHVEVLDAPVSGGIPGARNATLAVMVGGDRATFEKIKPALDAIGDKVSYVGECGAGSVAKLVHNMVAICSTQLLAEAFTMGVKAGVAPDALLKAVQDGAYGKGMLLTGSLPKMVFRGNFDRVSFALKLARKDLGLATEVGRELNVPMPLANLVEQDLLAAIANGLGDKDSTVAVTIQEGRAAVKIRT